MRTMTCKQMGGPCEFAHHGNTADEVIKDQDKHLKEMVAGGGKATEKLATDGATMAPIGGLNSVLHVSSHAASRSIALCRSFLLIVSVTVWM